MPSGRPHSTEFGGVGGATNDRRLVATYGAGLGRVFWDAGPRRFNGRTIAITRAFRRSEFHSLIRTSCEINIDGPVNGWPALPTSKIMGGMNFPGPHRSMWSCVLQY